MEEIVTRWTSNEAKSTAVPVDVRVVDTLSSTGVPTDPHSRRRYSVVPGHRVGPTPHVKGRALDETC